MIYSALLNLVSWGTSCKTIGIYFPLTALSYKLLLKRAAVTFEAPHAIATGTKIVTDWHVSMVIIIIE